MARPVRRHPNDGLGGRLCLLGAWSFTLGLGVSSIVLGGPWTWPLLAGQCFLAAVALGGAVYTGRGVLNLFGTWDDGREDIGRGWND